MTRNNWIPAFAGMTLLLATPAGAEPAFARLYKQQYGYTPSCHACHKDGGGTALNIYGEQFKDAGKNLAAFDRIAGADADRDGAANGVEAIAKANPGARASTPASPGNWLDTASLIPREVQEAFPGVRSYLPRDALLTGADIARARSLGAQLSKADENTIYVPVENQKPVGAALIFPAQHRGRTFFLLLTTDRTLTVTSVRPLHGGKVPEAQKSTVYESFKGIPVDRLPAAQGDSVDAAITAAVKNAGTLLYVRLKSA
jgi:hypothetical protein